MQRSKNSVHGTKNEKTKGERVIKKTKRPWSNVSDTPVKMQGGSHGQKTAFREGRYDKRARWTKVLKTVRTVVEAILDRAKLVSIIPLDPKLALPSKVITPKCLFF